MIERLEVNSLIELQSAANNLLNHHPNVKIWALRGDLGAGKTALVKCFVRSLGMTDEVSSPTFSLINEYSGDDIVANHFDLYRTKSLAEILDIGFEDYIFSGNYCFIEWPEQIIHLLPDSTSKIITFEVSENGTRLLTVE